MADVARILGDSGISIEAVIQKEPPEGEEKVAVILLTRRVREKQMNAAIAQIEALDTIEGAVTRIRVEHLGSE
ncbi:MAG TPA: homoserine dehydrogenase, partial [Chromatiales bacterium]|nr:homoserine dehydrogenase [Chromatiales bacterium]